MIVGTIRGIIIDILLFSIFPLRSSLLEFPYSTQFSGFMQLVEFSLIKELILEN